MNQGSFFIGGLEEKRCPRIRQILLIRRIRNRNYFPLNALKSRNEMRMDSSLFVGWRLSNFM
jgi:hypothetical protein